LTQHLLQGRGTFINNRFIVQAKRDRQITDSAFRQQVLSTVNQVENIYWGLVSAYEDVQAKERALEQSKRLASDNRKQLEIGTLAPLDVTNADSSVATDEQSLVNSQTTLEYQQLVMKQAIARNLDDPILAAAPVIPTDRISLDKLEEETAPVETLVQEAYQARPEVEQAKLNLQNAELTVKAIKNGLLPQVDLYGFYGAAAAGGAQSPNCETFASTGFVPCPPNTVPTINYTNVFQNLFNSSNPDKGAGVNVNITLRNRVAQADQERSQLEFRQAQMKLAQLYVQIRIQVINAQYALTQDRASVEAAKAAREYQTQSLDAENKKYKLGASTTQLVLQQKRNVATAESNYITAITTYARDRASLEQILADTLSKYGIDLADTARGTVTKSPMVPGLVPANNPQPTQMQEQQAPGM
jgi:outer membrane protein TolC